MPRRNRRLPETHFNRSKLHAGRFVIRGGIVHDRNHDLYDLPMVVESNTHNTYLEDDYR